MPSPNTLAQRRCRAKPGAREREYTLRKTPRRREVEYKNLHIKRHDLTLWGKYAILSIRSRAKKNGMLCTITAADIVVPEFCPALGIKLEAGLNTPLNCSPSVDRFYNDGGYTPDNIRVISHRANQLKRDASIEELERVLHYMKVTGVP